MNFEADADEVALVLNAASAGGLGTAPQELKFFREQVSTQLTMSLLIVSVLLALSHALIGTHSTVCTSWRSMVSEASSPRSSCSKRDSNSCSSCEAHLTSYTQRPTSLILLAHLSSMSILFTRTPTSLLCENCEGLTQCVGSISCKWTGVGQSHALCCSRRDLKPLSPPTRFTHGFTAPQPR